MTRNPNFYSYRTGTSKNESTKQDNQPVVKSELLKADDLNHTGNSKKENLLDTKVSITNPNKDTSETPGYISILQEDDSDNTRVSSDSSSDYIGNVNPANARQNTDSSLGTSDSYINTSSKDGLNIKIQPMNIKGPMGPGSINADAKTEKENNRVENQGIDKVSISIHSTRGCLVNGKPYDPQNPPHGIQLFVDKKVQKSED